VFIHPFNPIVDINTSQNQTESLLGGTYPSGYKGICQGLQFVIEDYQNPSGLTPIGIKVRENNADIRVIGILFQGKGPSGQPGSAGSVGIQSQGLNCLIQGNTITGASVQGAQNWNIYGQRGVDGGGNIVNTPNEKQIFG
jgi:hypothetical protein